MTKYKLHPPVDMMGLIQEKGITCVEENLGTNADGYSPSFLYFFTSSKLYDLAAILSPLDILI